MITTSNNKGAFQMKSILAAIILLFSSATFAQVVSVNVFQPIAGGAPLTAQYFQEAKSILESTGAQVTITSDLSGTYRFAVILDNWEAYGRWAQALPSNSTWTAFQAKTAANPSAIQTDNILFNIAASAEPGGGPGAVTQITVWELTTGTMQQLVQGGLDAKPIHEKSGSAVSVLTTGGNRMYYLQRYPDMAAWGRDRDTPNPEFQAYMQSLGAANNGDLGAVVIDQFTTVGL